MQLILLAVYAVAAWLLWESAGVSDRIDQLMENGPALSRPAVRQVVKHEPALAAAPVHRKPIVQSVRLAAPACVPAGVKPEAAQLPCPGGGAGHIELAADICAHGGIGAWRIVANTCGEAV